MNDKKWLWVSLFAGFVVRLLWIEWFRLYPVVGNTISQRVEISTPTSSWKAMKEGIYLLKHGYSPYANNIFHSSPILLQFFAFIENLETNFEIKVFNLTNIVFITFDLIVCYNIYYIAHHCQCYLMKHFIFKYNESHEMNKQTTTLHSSKYFALIASLFYNINPFVIAVCVSKSNSNIIHALITSAIVLSMNFNFNFENSKKKGKENSKNQSKIVIAAFILALATVIDVYPIMLAPLCIQFMGTNVDVINKKVLKKDSMSIDNIVIMDDNKQGKITKIGIFFIFSYLIGLIFFFNYNILFLNGNGNENANWHFIKEFYFFMFEGNDCLPNIGPWWYMRLQLFPQFLSFFTIILQSQPLIFVIGYLVRFENYPHVTLYLLIHCFETFRVYPTISDTMFGLVLYIAISSTLHQYMKHLIPLTICMITSIILMYFEWYMWIDAGIGNANFYYGANLFYVLCNLYMICASIAAARQYIYHKEKDESLSTLKQPKNDKSE